MKFSLLTLASVVTMAHAALKTRCAGFEEPSSAYNTTLEIASKGYDTSVLIFRLSDLPHTNIPLGLASEDALLLSNDFNYCSQELVAAGLCEADQLHTFTIKQTTQVQQQIANVFVPNGESIKYDVKESGIYCAMIYQEGTPKLLGSKWYEQHSWGSMSLIRWEYLQSLTIQLIWFVALVAICAYWCIKFGSQSLFLDIFLLSSMNVSVVICKFAAYGYYEPASSNHGDVYDVFKYPEFLSTAILINFLLKTSTGLFGATSSDKSRLQAFTQATKKIRICTAIYFFFSFISAYGPAFEGATGFYSVLFQSSNVVTGLAWIPLYVYFWKTAKATEKASLDMVFARNFRISRKLFIWTPVSLWLTGVFTNAVIDYNLTKNSTVSPSFEAIFTEALDASVSTNHLVILFKHLPDFSIPVILSALIYIWRPSLLERDHQPIALDLEDEFSSNPKLNEKA